MQTESVETGLPSASGRVAQPGALRLGAVAACLAWGLAAATLVLPFASRPLRLTLRRFWARCMLDAVGLELRVEGEAIAPGALLVANHVSWVDVLLLASVAPAVFVAKSEVRRWPAIGWLAARTETVFLRRASGRSLLAVKNRIAALLVEGRSVALFPEGTTSDGASVLPFRSGLLQSAVDCNRPLQAIAISYSDARERRSAAAAFVGGTTLWQSVMAVCGSGRIRARVSVAPPVAPGGRNRKGLARESRAAVAAMLAERN